MHCKYTLYILILAIAVNSTYSKNNIWLALRFKKNALELKCQVLNPNLSINIYSTHENLIGQCLTFPSAECYCFRNYSKIAFDENTNETILTLWRLPNYSGNWTCRHGVSSNDPSATVDIDLGNVCKTEDGYRHDSVIVICIVSFVILMVMCGCVIYNRQTCVRRREGGNSAERAHLGLSFQIGIKLYGEQVVKRLDFIHLNCTTESVPLGHAIEINVNQESFTIRLLQDKCFSSVVGGQCAPKICQCSARGLWYSHILQADVSEGNIDITCSMVFKSTGILSDSIQVKIIDFSGPKIRTDVEFPIHSGTVVEFICDLERSNKNITFVWDCANKETTFSGIEKNGKSSSNIFRTIALLDDNTSCTCTVNVNGYVATDAIKIYISKNPNIYSNETLHCNNTLHIEMSCTISTELPVYGFDMWTHSFHGTALRYLKGRVKDNQSILTLTNCSYQDAGDYECVAWTKFEGKSYFTNKSIDVYVNSPPVIVSANKIRQTKSMILTVKFCSSEETNTLWSKDKSVVNTAGITHVVLNRTIPLQMYNKTIFCEGYIANLSIISGKAGTYVLRIQNDFGETRQAFSVDVFQTTGLTTTFDFRSVIIGITIVGIVILIISVTVILMKGKGSNIVHIVGPHEMSSIPIYHSAPSSEPVIHIYDDAIPGYLEVIENPSENEDTESDETSTNTITNTHIYEEVD